MVEVEVDDADRQMIERGDRIGAKLARELLRHHDQSATLIAELKRERDEARSGHADSRANFLTMQNAAADLTKRAEKAERELEVSDLEGNHAYALAVDDPGKNPPVLWRTLALAAETRCQELQEALEGADQALCDWLNSYAPDLCDHDRAKLAQDRIGEFGTIAYIANALKPIRAALSRQAQP